MDVGDALRTHVNEKLEDINSKYFNHATFATVTFSKEGHGHGQIKAHIQIRIGKDISVMADTLAGDAHGAFDAAAEKVAKQMRRPCDQCFSRGYRAGKFDPGDTIRPRHT